MKKRYALTALAAILSGSLFSQTSAVLMSDNFTGLSNGNLTNANGGWVNTGNNNRMQVSGTSPLFYPAVITGSQYVNSVISNNADDPYKLFMQNQSVAAVDNTVMYISFVVRVADAASTVTANSITDAVLAAGNNGSNNRLVFFIGNNGNGANNLKFGITKTGKNGASFAAANYSFGTSHLVVIKYIYVPGNNNDQMYMWVDPVSIFSGELSVNTAAVAISNGSDNQFVLNSIGFEQSNNGAAASFDALRVSFAASLNGSSAAANSAAAWAALTPGMSPLPVSFGAVTAKLVSNTAEVIWETHSEENVNRYEVERSSDGQDFSTIGVVFSKNAVEKTTYQFTDSKPLQGKSYYRIRSVDLDGKFSYTVIVMINTGINETFNELQVYPNPSNGSVVNFRLSGLEKGFYTVHLFNISGTPVYRQVSQYNGGVLSQQLNLTETLKPGVYNMLITNGSVRLVKSITILK